MLVLPYVVFIVQRNDNILRAKMPGNQFHLVFYMSHCDKGINLDHSTGNWGHLFGNERLGEEIVTRCHPYYTPTKIACQEVHSFTDGSRVVWQFLHERARRLRSFSKRAIPGAVETKRKPTGG